VSVSIHPTALVETEDLGSDCVVGEHATVGASAVLEDGVRVGAGARLLGRVRIGASVSIGPNAVLGASGSDSDDGVVVGARAEIGANATVGPGLAIGRGAVVQPGATVDGDVPAYAVVQGTPARIVGYVDTRALAAEPEAVDPSGIETRTRTGVSGVLLVPLTSAQDLRGSLAALEFADLPFAPRRAFAVYDVPNESVRGAHAHRTCAQVLVCVAGEVSCVADDGTARQAFRLTNPTVGLYLPPLVWGMQYRYSRDAVLLVLAELPYDPDDYVRDYEEFLELAAGRAAEG
jgi:UDP-2-acetamido-3-amino-2,3-dideoxy-glucuronate N-acetyltransferase